MENKTWVKYNHDLMFAKGFIDKNGELIELNPTDKLLYLYVKDRMEFFKSIGKEYFESHETISFKLCISRRTVGRWVNKMKESGVLDYKIVKVGKGIGCIYTYIGELKFPNKMDKDTAEWKEYLDNNPVNMDDKFYDPPF